MADARHHVASRPVILVLGDLFAETPLLAVR
jgi:hypothetical protein